MTISPAEFVERIRAGAAPLFDVRAPAEFWEGHMPESVSSPLLYNDERHLVGIRYKEQGQEAAIALGHMLVDPLRWKRVDQWKKQFAPATPVITCFRGGLRSATAQRWLREEGVSAPRLAGGYKALRRLVTETFHEPHQGFLLSGLTGAGKTEFLNGLPGAIDLEGLARHRGSAFGGWLRVPQPSQATFENSLGYALLRKREEPLVVESESRLIGRVVIPDPFYASMSRMPRVILDLPQEERARRLTEEYVLTPLNSFPQDEVQSWILGALARIRDRLGGMNHGQLDAAVRAAFSRPTPSAEEHVAWVQRLLELYYDPLYRHSLERNESPVIFSGSAKDLMKWFQDHRIRTM
ncbi:MAG: tRNA 2-selenouridine(34) synthase MnmH [Bdellovibrionales bacterium]|nr:tRNA 2-selenouridine(34) synthase MnmH [Bdellovibrionales bacterium]